MSNRSHFHCTSARRSMLQTVWSVLSLVEKMMFIKNLEYTCMTTADVARLIFTCVSYAEARNRYRLDVRLSVCHMLALYQNGLTYCHAFFTTR